MPVLTAEEMEKARKYTENKMRIIDFQVDTVSAENAAGAAAYFTTDVNTITSNYVIDEDEFSHRYNQNMETLIHEQKHRDNYQKGMYAYAVSPEQAYKREMHDEISAMMTEIVSLRDKYLKTGDIHVFDESPKLKFYADAIKHNIIKPGSPHQEDFDAEMRFIVNGSQDVWMKNWGHDFYVDNGLYHAMAQGDFKGEYSKYWDKNYQNAMKIAYNIGGIDFTQYMNQDVEIPQEAKDKITTEAIKYYSYYQENNPLFSDAGVFAYSGLPSYDGSISLSEYKQLLQHQIAINDFAGGYSTKLEDGSVRSYTPQEYLQSLNSKETIKSYRKFYNEASDAKNPDSDEVKARFPTFESYINYIQSSEAKNLKESLRLTPAKERFIDKMVEYQAQQYAKTGKEFPVSDNNENYLKSLKKMYGSSYDFLKPNKNKINGDLSEKTQQIINDSSKGFVDKVKDKWQSFKHNMTHIKDENSEFDDEKYVGVWGKIKHEVKDGNLWDRIKNKAKETTNNISSWFSGDNNTSENPKNQPVNPVKNKKPEYREWKNEDGSRVSKVQHSQILDMNKPIISRPTLSQEMEQPYVVKQDNLKVREIPQHNDYTDKNATIAKMKKDVTQSKTSAQQKQNIAAKDKTAVKTTMRQDAANAQKITNRTTPQKKVAKLHNNENGQIQMLKDFYHKLFDR